MGKKLPLGPRRRLNLRKGREQGEFFPRSRKQGGDGKYAPIPDPPGCHPYVLYLQMSRNKGLQKGHTNNDCYYMTTITNETTLRLYTRGVKKKQK